MNRHVRVTSIALIKLLILGEYQTMIRFSVWRNVNPDHELASKAKVVVFVRKKSPL